jgi:hypothetical protein
MGDSSTPSQGGAVRNRWLPNFAGDPAQTDRAASLLSRTVAAGAIALIVATRPLWTPQAVFPRVPFFAWLRGVPDWLEWTALSIVTAGLVGALLAGSGRRIGRWSLVAFAGGLFFLALADQQRLQPWAYQFFLLSLVLAVLPAGDAIVWSRMLIASLYVYSALSKLDWSFIESGGGQIVQGLLQCLPLDRNLSATSRRILAGSLAGGELLIGIGLCFRPSRRIAFYASLVMHALLIAALGPWGAHQKPGVLLWNAWFLVQNLVLFAFAGDSPGSLAATPPAKGRATRLGLAVRGLIVLAVCFPLTQPFGLCDVWPAWAVYATGPERLRVYINLNTADIARVGKLIGPYVDPPRFLDNRCLVRIDRWSLDATQAPLYPQNRFRLGVALALAKAARLEQTIYVELESPADRWTGKRSTRALAGSAAIASELDRDWLNGLPRP